MRRSAILLAALLAAALATWSVLRRNAPQQPDAPARGTATLIGSVGPPVLLAQLRTEAGVDRGPGESRALDAEPGIQLRRAGELATNPHARTPLARDGSFRIEGIQPGTWQVRLIATRRFADGTFQVDAEDLGAIAFAAGETVERRWQLDTLVRGRLRGRVLINGAPHADGQIRLIAELPTLDGGSRGAADPALTGPDGSFDALVRPGKYRVSVRAMDAASQGWWVLPADEEIAVPAAGMVEQTFHLACRAVRLRLLDGSRAPVPGVLVALRSPRIPAGLRAISTPSGTAYFVSAPAGELLVQVVPRELREVAVATWLLGEGPADTPAFAAALVSAATFAVEPGDGATTLDVQLPKAAGY